VGLRRAWQLSGSKCSDGASADGLSLRKLDSVPKLHQRSLFPEKGMDVSLLAASRFSFFPSF